MKQFLKYGGLFMSSLLTIGLFIDLFGNDAYGILMAGAALALFEGGSIAWANILTQAKHGQRIVARFAMWFCILASLVSSGAQIILTTDLWKPQFDTGFVALITIVLALVVNVAGIFGYEYLDPERAELNRELDRGAKAKAETDKLTDRVTNQALIKAGSLVNDVAGDVSKLLAAEIQHDVVTYLLSQTRGGANMLPSRIIDQPPQHATPDTKHAEPTLSDKIKGVFLGSEPAAPQPQTMAAQGQPPATNENPSRHETRGSTKTYSAPPPATPQPRQPHPAPDPTKPDVLEVTRADGSITIVSPGEQFTVQESMTAGGSVWPPGIYEYSGHDDIDLVEDWSHSAPKG